MASASASASKTNPNFRRDRWSGAFQNRSKLPHSLPDLTVKPRRLGQMHHVGLVFQSGSSDKWDEHQG
ncbi:uncharacterized protein EAE98_000093 [Botrytis deweyae]|uniref:Uncharacterized protein n=1 Tax=Botrytis deweyae TaxID=2478750 RepID=A0ABQ7J1Z0_9HELO|nr:uncharacterized protein EAE98_000093 [Botrytis deweyae]KAF7939966.1 hypothetical protein EAE98_000093 [Botrytis deweyae]